MLFRKINRVMTHIGHYVTSMDLLNNETVQARGSLESPELSNASYDARC